jgi:hypothetical protein
VENENNKFFQVILFLIIVPNFHERLAEHCNTVSSVLAENRKVTFSFN